MNNANNYPVETFPPFLRDVITALHEDMSMPVEMIGSTVLAALSLALQPLIDIASPFANNKTEPCSLYFLVLAKSGEGKSPVRERVMEPFEAFSAQMHEEYEARYESYQKDHKIWAVKRKSLESTYKKASRYGGDCQTEELLLSEHLDIEPEPPRAFEMFYDDATPEGMIQGLKEYPYAGVFADEAITFFTGHLKNNLGLLNKIWKNEPLSLSRKKDGNIRLNAYLTFSLMVQRDIFEEYLKKNAKVAMSSGFLARFLFTDTVSTIEQRVIKLEQGKSRQALDILFERFNKYLREQKEHFYDKSLTRRTLLLSDEAKRLYEEKVNEYPRMTGRYQWWEHIPEFVSKAGSHAIRIAALFSHESDDKISASTLRDAFILTEWHLHQAGRYFYCLSDRYRLEQDVYELFDWIKNRFNNPKGKMNVSTNQYGGAREIELKKWQPFLKNEIMTNGPARLRKIDNLMPVLNQLIGLSLIMLIEYPDSHIQYVARAVFVDIGSNLPYEPFFERFNIKCDKYDVPRPLDNFDRTRLQWD
ncbi:YfjI family protein [Raoultella ornithinolytica]|uniref:YfjI family protein n=1 Tax=Raoultella ornithinolytica TaxID=54291 RepID=UPI0021AE98D3|nr:YfjI family protein [Raoultella ornithinolytica]MCT4737195.1 DUF3987 domain-containing protein [Raoultella ornithinolytica]